MKPNLAAASYAARTSRVAFGRGTAITAAIILLCFAELPAMAQAVKKSTTDASSGPEPARLNVTGAWDGNFWGGSDFHLSQDGDRVWGKFGYGNGYGFARGSWND